MKREPEIYCPHCTYWPQPEDVWECVPSCSTLWNTFWTGGLCPGCGYHWSKTQCSSCGELSPHEDWYHYPAGESSQTEDNIELTPDTITTQ